MNSRGVRREPHTVREALGVSAATASSPATAPRQLRAAAVAGGAAASRDNLLLGYQARSRSSRARPAPRPPHRHALAWRRGPGDAPGSLEIATAPPRGRVKYMGTGRQHIRRAISRNLAAEFLRDPLGGDAAGRDHQSIEARLQTSRPQACSAPILPSRYLPRLVVTTSRQARGGVRRVLSRGSLSLRSRDHAASRARRPNAGLSPASGRRTVLQP